MEIKFDGVMETLLITLYIRAKDANSKEPIINDKKAAQIISKIDYNFSKFENAWGSYYGTLARVKVMDEETRKFIAKNPDCVIVSVGCGLDTRFERVDNGKITWYNLDFPEVIEKRNLLFEKNSRVIDIPKSALDESWGKDIKTNGKPLLILSEGVLMYLKEDEIKKFLNILTDSFDSFEAHFDLLYKGLVKRSKEHDTLKHMKVNFEYGVKDGSELVKLNPKLKQIGLINFTREMKKFPLGIKKIFLPLMYIANDRLGMYTYNK
ncbi:MAG: class I SAM-dependent methyltransferase [Peptoanaerobacter stomatis]|uniref:class I SAM-dependent methyltransferase n=1 Tax=Peptoanaerobacter stomatis TaxID=796937 RepID=UPI003F9EE660